MKLWSLTINKSSPTSIDFMLIQAETENDARLIAAGCDWRNPSIWIDPKLSDCNELLSDGIPKVLQVTYT